LLFSGPFVSALANRYGFRLVAILGSVISCAAFVLAYFSTSIEFLYISYGAIGKFFTLFRICLVEVLGVSAEKLFLSISLTYAIFLTVLSNSAENLAEDLYSGFVTLNGSVIICTIFFTMYDIYSIIDTNIKNIKSGVLIRIYYRYLNININLKLLKMSFLIILRIIKRMLIQIDFKII